MIDEQTKLSAKHSHLLADLAAEMRKVSGTSGGEFAGSCPFCGGEDRFHVQPFHPAGPCWFCRHCTEGAWKDAIDFVRRRDNCSFVDAIATLVGEMPAATATPPTAASMPRGHTPTAAPNSEWQQLGRAFVAECQDRLWSSKGQVALNSLHSRGFSDGTIKKAGLGWNDRTRYEDRSDWGLALETNSENKPRRVWLPRGWVLPWCIGDDLWRISIRRPKPDLETTMKQSKAYASKYVEVSGGSAALYNADTLRPDCQAVIVEGIFDALSIQQQAGDIVVPVATGSTTGARRVKWIARLALADTVLVAYDADKPGQEAAEYWLKTLPNAKRWRPWWDDPNQLAIDGVNLRDWLLPALPTRPQQQVLSNDPTVVMRNRLSYLLASGDLTPSQSHEAQQLGDQLMVKVRIERYYLNEPFQGWQAVNQERQL